MLALQPSLTEALTLHCCLLKQDRESFECDMEKNTSMKLLSMHKPELKAFYQGSDSAFHGQHRTLEW